MSQNKYVALIPAYEPDELMLALCEKLIKEPIDIVIVDDGSGPEYHDLFLSAKNYGHVISYDVNQGKGYAIREGLKYIYENYHEQEIVVTLDADGQHTVEDTMRVCRECEEHPEELVLGSRAFRGDVPFRSRFGNSITRFVYRCTTGVKVKDTQTGLRAFSVDQIPFMLKIEGNRYEYEMNVLLSCAREKIKMTEIEIETIYLADNASSHFNPLKDSLRVYKEILKFAASSLTGFVVDYIMYSILLVVTGGLGETLSVPMSNVLARIVSSTTNFTINKKFVFKNKDSVLETGLRYFILAACILCGNTILLSCMVKYLHINKYAGKLIAEVLFFTISWLAQRFFIFSSKEKQGKNKKQEGKR